METLVWLLVIFVVIAGGVWAVAKLRRTFSKEIERAKRIQKANRNGQ